MNTSMQTRWKKYKNQFVTVGSLTVVMMFGFQNCAKVTAELSSVNSSVNVSTKGLSLTSSGIGLGDSSIPLTLVSDPSDQVQTQVICDMGGMYVDPVQGKCPEGTQQIGGDSKSSISFRLPNQDIELAINALDSQMVDLGECLTDLVPQLLAKNPRLKILMYVPANDQLSMYSLVNGWMDSRINSLKDSNGVLLSAEVRKDIISRYRVAVRTAQDGGFEGVVNVFAIEKYFILPVSQILKVSSLVRFNRNEASSLRCDGGSSIRPMLQLRINFQGLASNLKIHLQHQDQSLTSLQKFSIQVNPASSDPDDKILSIDMEDLVGVTQITLEHTP